MKKIIALILTLTAAATLASCGGGYCRTNL